MKKIKAILWLFLLMPGEAVAQTTEYDTDRGFIHPGGLHTQEDFDRVKAQLAADNTKVKQAWQKLTSSEYSQSGVQTYPTEIIVRGGGSGENYMNAARGAAMAYQNALRWKIAGTKANANAAVRILMQWANTTKAIGGDSNYALAAGLYGYQFAQAAELMRDYEGWSREDFAQFQQWMLTVWYPSSIGFLRGRNGTWENAGKWWQAPGHYWSNWGLCNALCVISIGILCDDVFIYNQGMSYFKYDQCGTFKDPRTEVPIKNDGLTEFLGNLVVTTYDVTNSKFKIQSGEELETGAYGEMGQLNDAGHSSMSLGVALDVAKVGWNQGDDLFAYMNHRMAAGIEYLAAQSLSVEGLPWVDYIYGTNGYYYTDSRCWTMTEPAMGAQMRPYWGTVIGIYEGVKGVTMPFAEQAYANMGIDGGGQGSTSGGYDHLGFSVLMNTYDEQPCPAYNTPTELTPKMEYGGNINASLIPSLAQEKARGLVVGKTIYHNELGGLVNTYTTNNKTGVPAGTTITLMPQLPEGEEDTGNWIWNTGETTRDLAITADKSYIYRVTYTNSNGVKSQLAFSIFVQDNADTYVLTTEQGYSLVHSTEDLAKLSADNYFVLASDQANLFVGLNDAPKNGNKALFFQTAANPLEDLSKLFTFETYNDAFCLRNVEYDGLLLQTEWDKPWNFRTNDQPLPCQWTQMFMHYADGAWTIENGKYPDNWLGLWTPQNGYADGEEIAFNKTGDDIARFQIYAISKKRFHTDYILNAATASLPTDITPFLVNPSFANANGFGWTLTGTWGNQRYNGAAEVWHSTGFDISQTITGLPDGEYTVTCQMVNGEGSNTGYLYATSGDEIQKATVSQSCAGSDFDTQRDQMIADANYGKLSVTLNVTNGTLILGVKEPSDGKTWLVFDDFTLSCNNCSKAILMGDVNSDGVVSIADVTLTVSHILGRNTSVFSTEAADVNNDDTISVADVTAIINVILHKSVP